MRSDVTTLIQEQAHLPIRCSHTSTRFNSSELDRLLAKRPEIALSAWALDADINRLRSTVPPHQTPFITTRTRHRWRCCRSKSWSGRTRRRRFSTVGEDTGVVWHPNLARRASNVDVAAGASRFVRRRGCTAMVLEGSVQRTTIAFGSSPTSLRPSTSDRSGRRSGSSGASTTSSRSRRDRERNRGRYGLLLAPACRNRSTEVPEAYCALGSTSGSRVSREDGVRRSNINGPSRTIRNLLWRMWPLPMRTIFWVSTR